MKKTLFTTLLSILSLTLMLASCGNKDDIVITGTLENGANKTIYIEEMSPESRIFLDSVKLDSKGHFKYRYAMSYKTFINVHISDDDYIVLLPELGEKTTIRGDYNSIATSYKIEGGTESQLLWQLQDYSNQGTEVLKDIVATDSKNRQLLADGDMSQEEYDHEHDITDSIYAAAYAEQQQYVVHFIEDNLGSLTTLIALYKPFNNHPLIDPSNSFEFYEAVLEGLQEKLPDNPHTLHFKNVVERIRYQYVQ